MRAIITEGIILAGLSAELESKDLDRYAALEAAFISVKQPGAWSAVVSRAINHTSRAAELRENDIYRFSAVRSAASAANISIVKAFHIMRERGILAALQEEARQFAEANQ